MAAARTIYETGEIKMNQGDITAAHYILQALSGAFTGYITNTYAINMLFREYTPLKIGGVIKKTRAEFIENVSSLVERDIINHNTLIKEIEKEEFKRNIDSFSAVFLKESIYEKCPNGNIEKIPGYEQTQNGGLEFINAISKEHLEPMLRGVLSIVDADSIAGEKQLKMFFAGIMENLLEILSKDGVFEEEFSKAYGNISSLSPKEIAGGRIKEIISGGADKLIYKLPDLLEKKYRAELKKSAYDMMDSAGIDEIIRNIQGRVYEKRIIDIIGGDGEDLLFEELVEKIRDFINSSQGRNIAEEFSSKLIEGAKGVDKSVLDIMTKDFKAGIEGYLRKNLPHAVSAIIRWIEENEGEIEDVIQEAVDDAVDSAEGMKGMILGIVKDSLLNDIAKKYDIVAKIVSYLEEKADMDTISREISEEIIGFIKKRSIRDIITLLEEKGLLTSGLMASFMVKNADRYIGMLPRRHFERILKTRIGSIVSVDFVRLFEGSIKEPLADRLLEKFVFSKGLGDMISQNVRGFIEVTWTDKLSDRIKDEDIPKIATSINDGICSYISSCKEEIANKAANAALEWARGKTLADIAGEREIRILSQKADATIQRAYLGAMNWLGKKSMRDMADRLNSVSNIEESVSGFVQGIVKGNLENFVQGNIKSLVAKNIGRLDDDELCEMVQEFMGKELKPITGFGAVLGFFAGIALASFEGTNIYVNIPVYALVGWITNVIAIWMIFRPYKKIEILSKIPLARMFSQGYIVKNKPKFAQSMSRFVEEELMDRKSIGQSFESQKDVMERALAGKISKDDYEAVSAAIGRYQDEIQTMLGELVQNISIKNKQEISTALSDAVFEINMKAKEMGKLVSRLKSASKDRLDDVQPLLYDGLTGLSRSSAKLDDVLSNGVKNAAASTIESKIEGLMERASVFLNDAEKVKSQIESYSEKYSRIIKRPVADITGEKMIEDVKERLRSLIDGIIASKKTRRKTIRAIEGIFERELSANRRLDEIFSGALKGFVSDNADDVLEKLIAFFKHGLSSFGDTIKEQAKESVKGELGMVQKGMYMMFGGDDIIDGIVHSIIEEKVPKFLDAKKYELRILAKDIIENRIYAARLSEFNVSLDKIEIASAMDDFMSRPQNTGAISKGLCDAAGSILDVIAEVPLESYLKMIGLSRIEDAIYRFNGDIESVSGIASELAYKNAGATAKSASVIIGDVLQNEIWSQRIRDILDCDEQELKGGIFEASQKLSDLSAIIDMAKELSGRMIDGLYQNICDEGLERYISRQDLAGTIEGIVLGTVLDERFSVYMEPFYRNVVSRLKGEKLSFADMGTKDYLTRLLTSCVMDALGKTLPDILRDIDFKGITRDEINNMEPQEIHALFNSFAGDYFTRLRLYGLFGGIFGTHPAVTGAAAAAFFGKRAADKSKG